MSKKIKEDIISPVLLRFRDKEVQTAYSNTKKTFFLKTSPLLALAIFGISITVELIQRLSKSDDNFQAYPELSTTIFNWSACALFLLLCVLIKFTHFAHFAVCPLLTVFIYYYLCMFEYHGKNDSIDVVYFSVVIGITTQFYILVMFSENWLLSSVIFSPCMIYFMYRT